MFKKLLLVILVLLTCSNATLQKFTDGESWYSVTRNDGISITKNRVGILTTTPSYTLDVRGTVNATSYIGAFNGSLPTYVVTNNYHGSVTANYFIGDGSLLTNIVADTISGDVTLQSVTINGSLYVSSSAVSIFGDSVTINGNLYVSGNSNFGDSVTINGNLYVSGNSNLGSGAGLSISQNPYSPNISPNYTTPNVVGQVWINTANYSMYMAAHTNNYAGWGYIGRASATTFNKDTVPGLIAWYDASDSSNLTLSGTNVTGWYDLSGLNNHMTVDTNSPTYVANIQNGRAGIYFNGTNQALKNTTSIADVATPYTVILCVRPTNWGTGGYQTICGSYYGACYAQLVKLSGSTVLAITTGVLLAGPTLTNSTTYIIAAVFNGDSSQIWLNGSLSTTGNAGTGGLADTNMGNKLGLGEWWQGYGFEQFYYSGALSDEQLSKIFTYLNNKWAVY